MSSDQRWQRLDKRLVVDRSPFARAYDLDFRLPDGRVITNWLQVDLPPFAITFPLTTNGDVIFVRQYRQVVDDYLLELSAGHLEADESPQAAAARELLEECGAVATDWRSLGRYVMDANRGCGWAHVFLAREAQIVAPSNSGDIGEISVHLLPLPEVKRRWQAGEFVSAPTALAIGLALAALGV
ncbi:MAG: NUDIX hydrolase [Anaerolineae bacterium]|nr:NUDIX hydrolase [Anaerolineae bacterium]MDW8298889.1 NUDIX hydrolase [Anaerolineae bacterium]